MRAPSLALLLAATATSLTARTASATQATVAAPQRAEAAPPESSSSVEPQQRAPALTAERKSELDALISRFRSDPEGAKLPAAESITMGSRTIAAGTRVDGPVAVAGGPLHVYGTVTGDAIAVDGDVIVHAGGVVNGNAVSALGRVVLDGGSVTGEMRQLSGEVGAVPRTASETVNRVGSTRQALALSSSWLVILILIGIGVLVFASDYLDAVVESLEGRFGRSFWAGIGTQLALAPVLCLLIVALALTIIGVLLIPFAIVAFVLAVAGLVTLGFLAVARITGESVAPGTNRRYHARGAALRALVVGVVLYLGLWVVAAAFTWAPVVSTVLRIIAVAITWVAATAGLGAAVISRGGTRRPVAPALAASVNDVPWQTPTPVTGVVAARRPTPASSASKR